MSEPPKLPSSPSLAALHALLRSLLRITTTDHRIFLGTFVGTDKDLNILLVNTDEFRISPPPSSTTKPASDSDLQAPTSADPDEPEGESEGGRYVGQVMIPWKMIKRIEAETAGVDAALAAAASGTVLDDLDRDYEASRLYT